MTLKKQLAPATPGDLLKRVVGAAAVAAAMLATPAHADIITFDDFFGPVTHADGFVMPGFEVGFFSNARGAVAGADLVGSFIDGTDTSACIGGSCPVNNSTTYYGALDDSYVDIYGTLGAGFQIKGFDASFIGGTAPGTTYPAIAGLLRIQGFYGDGSSVYETYNLNGPVGGNFLFSHFDTSAAFASQTFTEVLIFGFACENSGNCAAFSTDRGQFGIDNIDISTVPEPSSAMLIALGMIGVGAFARRRQARASV